MGKKAVKLADVAEAAGVSTGTASNVFSRPEVVREEMRQRVLAAAERLGYAGPSALGRMLRAGRVNAIGVATAEPLAYFFEDPFARVVMRGISHFCDERGAGIALVSAASNEQLAWNIQSAVVDGFIVFCIEGGERLIELTRERRLPYIAIDYGYHDPSVPTVGIDERAGAALAARHLTGLGHRKFGVVAIQFGDEPQGPASVASAERATYSGTRDRMIGYASELSIHGIDLATLPVFETNNDTPTTRAALEYIFAVQPDTTALLCMSDRTALAALQWLAERGMAVPARVSVVGFDGVPEGETAQPPLTTIAQPMLEFGRYAASAILDGPPDEMRKALPVELVVRGSTGKI